MGFTSCFCLHFVGLWPWSASGHEVHWLYFMLVASGCHRQFWLLQVTYVRTTSNQTAYSRNVMGMAQQQEQCHLKADRRRLCTVGK